MSDATSRLGLILPAGGEDIDVNDINNNSLKIDKSIGAFLVNPGVIPPDADLYDGAMVAEKTTGIVWMAQKSGSAFIRRPFIYPWRAAGRGQNLQTGVPNDRTMRIAQINTTLGTQINSTGALRQLQTDNFTIDLPVRGVYRVEAIMNWGVGAGAAGSSDYRAITLYRLSTTTFDGHPTQRQFFFGGWGSTDRAVCWTEVTELYNAGESLRVGMWQQSGGGKDVGTVDLRATLLFPAPDAVMP